MRVRLLLFLLTACGANAQPYPLFYTDAGPFREAHARVEREGRPLAQELSGVTVPHHLLALDLIAETLWMASAGKYERIVLLTPEHFKRGKTPASTTRRDFLTPLGLVKVDAEAVRELLQEGLMSESALFSHEHGVQALLPSVRHFFPDTPVVPVALDVRSTPEDWARLLPALAKCVKSKKTLVVQSTDFSHYLPQVQAREKDAETLRVLAAGDVEAIPKLDQPGNLDSKAAQWLMLRLQGEIGAAGVVLRNRNAIHYGGRRDEPETTSYITQLYSTQAIPGRSLPGARFYFGGDVHFGRAVASNLALPEEAARIEKAILDVTGGAPLIINLEGVMLPEVPAKLRHPYQIGMPRDLALAWLKRLKVSAVSLANNHSHDFGVKAYEAMKSDLMAAGIVVLEDKALVEMTDFRLGAATDVENSPEPAWKLLEAGAFAAWKPTTKPLFAFLHLGTEYSATPAIRESLIASWAEQAGARLILGSHPHRPSAGWERGKSSLRWYSMGNLLFDQSDPRNTGGLIEVRFLDQGTWTTRWLPLGNVFSPKP
ncbi:AmmeMemoRadiSam system protein B [Prosthecobacter sp.]|uniref:AmmeMemoRadiSam system protein B n=1 Tax=Prosthecobacter sp. TaxID=1965333 RepID=UPI003784698E